MSEERNVFQVVMDGETWRTRDGRVLEIGEMDPFHRENCVRLLERHARGIQIAAQFEDSRIWELEAYLAGDPPDGAWGAATGEVQDLYRDYERDPLEWLRDTPAYRALSEGIRPRHRIALPVRNGIYRLRRKIGI